MTDRVANACAAAGAGVLLFALMSVTQADPDLWGHVRFGLDMIATWQLPVVDPYSFTQDVAWINHEWLSELQMAAAFQIGGALGLALLKGLLVSLTLWFVWVSLRSVDLTVRTFIIGAVAVGLSPAAHTMRPQLWSFVAVAMLCRILTAERSRSSLFLPPLFLVWANLHGGVLIGLGILGAWAVGAVLADRRALGRWAAVTIACTLATLGTPYGFSLWRFLADTVQFSRPNIEEWQPLWTRVDLLALWVAATVASMWAIQRPHAHRVAAALVAGFLAYASLRVARILPLYVETVVMLLAPAVAARWPATGPRRHRLDRAERTAALAICVMCLAGAAALIPSRLNCIEIRDEWDPPSVAAREMLATALPGRLVSFFNWGQYALWHLSPTLRVSMDGRRETVYSDARLDEHADILAGSTAGLRVLESWRAEYVWLPGTTATKQWLLAHGYRVEWEAAGAYVAVREDLPRLRGQVTPPRSPRCFPE